MIPDQVYLNYIKAKKHAEACESRFNELGAEDLQAIDIAIYELHAAELRLNSAIAEMKSYYGKQVC